MWRTAGACWWRRGRRMSHREHIPVYGGDVADGHYYARGSAADEGFATVGEMDAAHPAMKDAGGWEGRSSFMRRRSIRRKRGWWRGWRMGRRC
jgi:hypothetical protein